MAERDLLAEVLRLSVGSTRLFRNSVGSAWLGPWRKLDNGSVLITRPVRVTYGLCVGSSDTIGWTSRVIQTHDVGRTFALWTAIECKSKDGRLTPEQNAFIAAVQRAGGIAAAVRSVDEARGVLARAI